MLIKSNHSYAEFDDRREQGKPVFKVLYRLDNGFLNIYIEYKI